MTTSLDSETDVNSLEPLDTNGEDGLVDLVSEDGTGERIQREEPSQIELIDPGSKLNNGTHGSTTEMGDPLSLTKPLPGVTKATAVCSDEQQHRLAYLIPNVKACHDLYSRRSVIRSKRKQQEHNQLVPHSIFLACSI